MEIPIIRKTKIAEFNLKEIYSSRKFRLYEGIDCFKVEQEDGTKEWRKEGPEGEILPEKGSLKEFLKLHPNKKGLVGEDGYYNWKKLKDIIKKEGYNPEEHDSYIGFDDFTEENGEIDYILVSGGHRITVMRELYNEGFFDEDYNIKVKINYTDNLPLYTPQQLLDKINGKTDIQGDS